MINLSGGVDSTYYLWRWLNEHPNERILVHHCLLFKRRREVEKTATENILKYFKDKGFNNIVYVESEFSRNGVKSKLYDIEVVYFLAGCVLKTFRKVKTVLMTRCKEEFNSNKELKAHFQKGGTLNNFVNNNNRVSLAVQFAKMEGRSKASFESPYQDKTKEEMIKEMPKELFALTWYCRSPVEGKPCKKCFNCRRVEKHKP